MLDEEKKRQQAAKDTSSNKPYATRQSEAKKKAYQQAQLGAQPKQAAQPASSSWYKGSKPTQRETLARIYQVGNEDETKRDSLMKMYEEELANPSSPIYNPYTQATTSKANKTNLANTAKAQEEWARLSDELSYWATRTDRNYSDDEIIARIDWDNYKTLQKMDEGRMSGSPLALTEAVGYSEDAMYGVLWAARNPEAATGDAMMDAAQSALGRGKQYHRNEQTASRLDPLSQQYNPYAVGSTVDNLAYKYRTDRFDDAWLAENRDLLLDADTAKDYGKIYDAVQNTNAIQAEVDALKQELARYVETGTQADFDYLLEQSEYKNLAKLQESLKSGQIMDTTYAIDFDLPTLKAESEAAYLLRQAQLNAGKDPEALETAVEAEKKKWYERIGERASEWLSGWFKDDPIPESETSKPDTLYDEDPAASLVGGMVWAGTSRPGSLSDSRKQQLLMMSGDLPLPETEQEPAAPDEETKNEHSAREILAAIEEGNYEMAAGMNYEDIMRKLEEDPELLVTDNAQKAILFSLALVGELETPEAQEAAQEYAAAAETAMGLDTSNEVYRFLDEASGGALSETKDNKGIGTGKTVMMGLATGGDKFNDVLANIAGTLVTGYGYLVEGTNKVMNWLGIEGTIPMAEKLQQAGADIANHYDEKLQAQEQFMRENATTAEYIGYTAGSEAVKMAGMGTVAQGIGAAASSVDKVATALEANKLATATKLLTMSPFVAESASAEFQDSIQKSDDFLTSVLSASIIGFATMATSDVGVLKNIEKMGKGALPEIVDVLASVPGVGVKAAAKRWGKGLLMYMGNLIKTGINEGFQEAFENVLGTSATAGLKGEEFKFDREYGAELTRDAIMGAIGSFSSSIGVMPNYAESVIVANANAHKSVLTPADVKAQMDAFANDLNNPEVMDAAKTAAAELAVGARTGELVAQGALGEIDTSAVDAAKEAAYAAGNKLAEAEGALEASNAAMERANEKLNANPADDTAKNDLLKAIADQQNARKGAIQARDEAARAEETLTAAQAEQAAATTEAMNAVREQARAEVTQNMAAVQEARLQQEAAAEVQRQNDNVLAMQANDFVDEYMADAPDDVKDQVRERYMAYDGETQNATRGMVEFASQISKKFGLNITFTDSHGIFEGAYKGGNDIVLDKNATQGEVIQRVLVHEITHAAESSKAYDALADAVLSAYYEGNTNQMNADLADIAQQYSEQAGQDSQSVARSELVAKRLSEMLSGNQDSMNRLVEEKPDVATRIWRAIKDFIGKLRGVRDPELDKLMKLEKQLEKALGSRTGGKNEAQFRFNSPVEESQGLIATHALSFDNLVKQIKLGGFAGPSIAVSNAKNPGASMHYGDTSVVFGRNTVDPEADPRNVLHSGDSFTPRGVDTIRDDADRVRHKVDAQKWNDLIAAAKEAWPEDLDGMLVKTDANGKKQRLTSDYTELSLAAGSEKASEKDFESAKEALAQTLGVRMAYINEAGIPVDSVMPDFEFTGDNAEQWYTELSSRIDGVTQDGKDVRAWVDQKLEGAERGAELVSGKTGKTYAYTPEGIVEKMHEDRAKGNNIQDGLFHGNGFWNATKEYKSLSEARKDYRRLVEQQTWTDKQKAHNDRAEERFFEARKTVIDETGDTSDKLHNLLYEMAEGKHDYKTIAEGFKDAGYKLKPSTIRKLQEAYTGLRDYYRLYYESKPDRPVGFDEVKMIVTPESHVAELQAMLEEAGYNIEVVGYKDGDQGDRLAKLNSDAVATYRFSLTDSNGDTVTLTQEEIDNNKRTVANQSPIVTLEGNPFAKNEEKDFEAMATEYFDKEGNSAQNPILGEVKIGSAGIKHLIGQKLTRRKTALLPAIKSVIEKGSLISIEENHKGKGFDSGLVAATVNLDGQDYYMGVAIRQTNPNDNSYYMHDAVLVQKNRASAPNKSGQGTNPAAGGTNPTIASILSGLADYNGKFAQDGGQITESEVRFSLPSNDILDRRIAQHRNSQLAPAPNDIIPGGGEPAQSYGDGERQFAGQTIQNSAVVPDWIKQEFLRPEELNYETDTNREQVERSWQRIQENGYEAERDRLLSLDRYSADDTAEANLMMAMALREDTADPATFMALASHYNKEGTKAGQELQARKLFTRMSPTGARVWAAGQMESNLEEHMRTHRSQRERVDNAARKVADQIRDMQGGDELLRLNAGGDFTIDESNNRWGVPINEQQQALIDHYGLNNVARPGIFYNRATTQQRMLEAILATPNPLEVTGLGLNLIQRLEFMQDGEAVITNADLNYIGTQLGQFVAQGGDEGGREADLAVSRAYEAYGNITPSTTREKLRTWRYVSMLLSVPSAIRNVIGNTGQNVVNATAHGIAVELDKALARTTGQRTVEHLNYQERIDGWRGFVQETQNTFRDYFIDRSVTQRGNDKYNTNQRGRVYQTQFIETMRNMEGFLMSFGDRNMWRKAYLNSMAEQQKLADRNLLFNDDGTTRTHEQMLEQAEADANYATFTEDNAVSNVLSQLKNIPGVGEVIDFIMPFTGVPTNITRRMIQYSPIGLTATALRHGYRAATHQNFDQRAFVDGISRGLTGTALFGVGMLLAAAGVIKPGTGDEDDDKKYGLMTAMGGQYTPYVYNPLTDEYVSLAAFAPAASPLTMGLAAYEEFRNNEDLLQALISASLSGADQIFDASYMSGVQDIFKGYGSPAENIATTVFSNAVSQSVPALMTQLSNTIDPYVRDTKDKNAIVQALKSGLINRIPGLRQMLPEKVDVTGQTVRTKEGLRNFYDPFTTTDARKDPAVDELFRLSEALGSSSMLPSDALSGSKMTLTVSKQKVTVDGEGKETYRKRYGELWLEGGTTIDKKGRPVVVEGVRNLINSSAYQMMDDEERADEIAAILSEAKTGAAMEALNKYGAD